MQYKPNDRSCLPCTACCEGWLDVSELSVQAHVGRPCIECKSEGCGIYPSRPVEPCQTFFCAWRQMNTPLSDEMRPDLSGVIVVMDRMVWRERHVIVAIPTGEKISDKSLKYLQGLANLMDLNLLTVQHLMEDGKFTGASKLFAYGSLDFNEDMKLRFKDGKPDWLLI